jgi:hypothetical protein
VILVVAFSARMLAQLAVRGGHEVVAVDHFGDLDLERACANVSVPGPMSALVDAAAEIGAEQVVYGAGLENRPDLVERLAAGRELLGCSPESLRRVRDPEQLTAAGLPYPRTFVGQAPPSRDGRWLRKPLHSGGGRGVRAWRGGVVRAGDVVQERIAGLSCSAAAVGDGRTAVVLGLTEQLTGRREFGARGFTWCGNVSPPGLPDEERRVLARAADAICARVAEAFGLRGLFGVDLVWDGRQAWVVEVNPRPTASLEIIELAYGVAAFAAHLDGCAGRLPEKPRAVTAAGKAIVYATRDAVMPDTREWDARDLPHPGEHIAAHHPICTVVATAPTPESVLAELEARADAVRAELLEPARG